MAPAKFRGCFKDEMKETDSFTPYIDFDACKYYSDGRFNKVHVKHALFSHLRLTVDT